MNFPKELQIEFAKSPELEKKFIELGESISVPKGTIILKQGEICRNIYLLEKGVVRYYFHDNEGNDITYWFTFDGTPFTDVNGLIDKAPSNYYFETLEDCIFFVHKIDDIYKLEQSFPRLALHVNYMITKTLREHIEKIKDLQFRDAKSRYDNLIQRHPDILQRVALSYIASYLGITQQSLSRIRKQH